MSTPMWKAVKNQNARVLLSEKGTEAHEIYKVTDTTNAAVQTEIVELLTDGTPADNLGSYKSFKIENDANESIEMARMEVIATDVTDGSEDAKFIFKTRQAGALTTALTIDTGASLSGVGDIDMSSSASVITFIDNTATALQFKNNDGGVYMTFDSTNSADRILMGKQVEFADSIKLCMGTGDDICFDWDGTRFNITQATANSEIRYGVDGAGIDQRWYGDTAGSYMLWDQSADALRFSDSAPITFGDDNDITAQFDATNLVIATAVADTGAVVFGSSGAGVDVVFYGDTATRDVTWDQSADTLLFNDNAKCVFGTGSDVTFAFDGTNFDITAGSDNLDITLGAAGNSFDLTVFGSTETALTWDASADTLTLLDTYNLAFGDSDDVLMRFSTGDASNHAFVIALDNTSQSMHITDVGAVATDWNVAAETHPTVFIHSNTTPATDYLRLGDHDGTTAYVDVVGGTTLALQIAGTTEASLTASALDISGLTLDNDDDDEIRLGTSADALFLWSTGDADNHSLVIALGNSNQAVHFTDVGAKATDWNVTAATHPEVFIHSNTTPATDYLRLGNHDGTTAQIDVVGGTTLALQISGTTEASLTASALDISGLTLDNDDDDEIRLGTSADALLLFSTGDASNHALVVALDDTSQSVHFTDVGAKATDWNVNAETHPTLFIHSNTTPATDYLKIGSHDGTTATLDVVGGTTLNLDIAGTNVVALATNLSMTSGHLVNADGGTVTQATSKSTGVTLNTESGQITMHNASLADATNVSFTVTNSKVGAQDVIIVNHGSAGTAGAYQTNVTAVGAGSFAITVRNVSGGALGEAIVLNFAIVGGAAS